MHQARRAALINALRAAPMHGLPAARYDLAGLEFALSTARSARDRGAVELRMTLAYLEFAHDLQSGILNPGQTVKAIKRGNPRRDTDTLLALVEDGDPRRLLHALAPQSAEYTRLMHAKLSLEDVVAKGGWGPRVPGGKLEPGDSGTRVVALRNRLVALGYLKTSASARFDTSLEKAVQAFQLDHGLEPDGVAGEATIAALNVDATDRLQSVLVAMERERWLNKPEGKGARHVLVNLVDFHARIMDDGKETFVTRSVIGHRASDRQSPEFSDVMEHMVINPYWYVPRSIIVKEYLPKLRQNAGAHSYLQILDSRGNQVSRANDFSQFDARSFPFSMRQAPGPRNALGTVKFMFPNKHNIYLHDTPHQSLFKRSVRTFSHGCIRLDDPHDFAYALLAVQEDDPVGFFQRILKSGANTRVELDQHIPVHLIYRTAFTQAKGRVQFRGDAYGRDAAIWRALAAAGVALPGAQG